jgi:hypothetical protein
MMRVHVQANRAAQKHMAASAFCALARDKAIDDAWDSVASYYQKKIVFYSRSQARYQLLPKFHRALLVPASDRFQMLRSRFPRPINVPVPGLAPVVMQIRGGP